MSQVEATRVKCEKCGREWNTRAKKKAICTNPECKSTKIGNVLTGERYNKKDPFIEEQEKETAASMKVEEIKTAEEEIKEQDFMGLLFESDGKTPKMGKEGMMDIFKGLPKPSPFMVSMVQNLSLVPTRFFGNQWIMAPEEAEMIARSAVPVLMELGINAAKIDPKVFLLLAVGLYALPRILVTIFSGGEQEPTPEYKPTGKKGDLFDTRTSRDMVEQQFDEVTAKYGGSLDEEGKDLHADRRGIKKPETQA